MSNDAGLDDTDTQTPGNDSVTVARHLTPEQVKVLLKALSKYGRHAPRNTALALLAYQHGLRIGEVCALQWSQLNLAAATIDIRRLKGGVSSLHPLTGAELRVLRTLQRVATGPHVFVSERGGPITPAGVRAIMRRLDVDLPRVNPHALRHACGYKLVNDGTDLRLVQAYLGHASIESTVRYTAVDVRRFRGLFD